MTDRYFGMKFHRAVREDPDVYKALEGWAFASNHIKKLESRIKGIEDLYHQRINSLQNRITNYQEDIAKLNNRISALETKMEASSK